MLSYNFNSADRSRGPSYNPKTNMTVESPDMNLVKKYLQDAGCYEERMGKEDMLSTYNVVKSSESTANEEKERRLNQTLPDEKLPLDPFDELEDDLLEAAALSGEVDKKGTISSPRSSKKNFTQKTWSHQKRQIDNSPTPQNTSVMKRQKAQEIMEKLSKVDVTKALPTKHKPLEIIFHKPKYDGPYYCHNSLKGLSIKEKIQHIAAYHVALATEFNIFSRRSSILAEWGSPIYANPKFNGHLEKKASDNVPFIQDEESNQTLVSPDETYISRGGRQIKRKLYSDDFSDEENDKKKQKPEQGPKAVKRTNIKKLSNKEIMSKSSLFSDSPSSKTRAEKLFDNLQKEEVKQKKADLEKEKFEATLQQESDDDFDVKITSSMIMNNDKPAPGSEEVELQTDGTKFVKKRVVPPIIGRKGYKRNQQLVPVSDNSPQASSSTSSTTHSKKILNHEVSESLTRSTVTPPRSQKKKEAKCPICSRIFSLDEIEAHASTCGLTSELEIQNNLPNKDNGTTTCDICDKFFPLNTEYEVHVKECIRRKGK